MERYFNATEVLQYYRKTHPEKPKKRMKDFFENSYVQEFIDILKANNLSNIYNTQRGRCGFTKMRSELFVLFLEWITPELILDFKTKYPIEYDLYLKIKTVSLNTTYKKKEIDFGNVLLSLILPKNTSIHKQYIINGKFIDFVVYKKNKEFGDSCILIEFDEEYHKNENQSTKDNNREKELSKFFESQKSIAYACLIRIPFDKIGHAYTYLLPYITGVETSISKNGIIDNLYYKCLYCED